MKVWKRVSAFLCAALLILNLALYPLRACAMAGALTAVGAAVTVSAFLMACGIYPYVSDEGQSFGEWGAQSLYDLWGQYVDSFEGGQLPSGGTVETFNQIKSFVVGGTLAIASGTWEMLRGFASWIVEKFKIQDNQTAAQLGEFTSGFPELYNNSGSFPTAQFMLQNGTYVGLAGSVPWYLMANKTTGATCAMNVSPWGGYQLYVLTKQATSGNTHPYLMKGNAVQTVTEALEKKTWTYGGNTYTYYITELTRWQGFSDISIPAFDSFGSLLKAYFGIDDSLTSFAGVHADTTTVAPLEPLTADTPWGGLSVPVQDALNPAGTVEQAVTDREKPVVRPVEVEIQQGTDVDTETGEITENPVVVSPEDVVPTVAALSPPASFISALQTTMTTKFPFCLPFDLFKILQAFYVAPEAPVFSLSFHDPFSNSDFSIRVDLSPWDEVAAVVRNFEAMILLAGFCLNFDKFNVIHLILGGLG